MGVDAASCSTQSRAGLRQQADVPVLVLDVHPHDLEPSELGLTDQLDVGEQRAVAAQPALRAQGVREQRSHEWTMPYYTVSRKGERVSCRSEEQEGVACHSTMMTAAENAPARVAAKLASPTGVVTTGSWPGCGSGTASGRRSPRRWPGTRASCVPLLPPSLHPPNDP